jgi:uncharacterized protein (DUF58 family)
VDVASTSKAIAMLYATVLLFVAGFLGAYPLVTLSMSLFLASITVSEYLLAKKYLRVLRRLSVKRTVNPSSAPETLPVRVFTTICNGSSEGITDIIVDEEKPPRTKRIPSSTGFIVDVPPSSCTSYAYGLTGAPGLAVSRRVVLEKYSPLGLFVAITEREEILTIRYYPLFASITQSIYSGESLGLQEIYSRRIKGVGTEFYSIREYVPGDDPRRIVWAAVARTGKLMVREDLAELRLRIHVFVDVSRPMWVGEPGKSPGDEALRLASSLADSARRAGGLLGYTFFSGEVWFNRYPGSASEVFTELYNRASMVDPYIVTPRRSLRRALEEASIAAEYIPLIIITGPGISINSDDVAEIARNRLAPTVIIYLKPPESIEAIEAEAKSLRDKFSNIPGALFIDAKSLGEALEALRIYAWRIARYAA